MTTPLILTLAEVDAIAAKMAAARDAEGWYALDGVAPPISPGGIMSLLRMARAIVVADSSRMSISPSVCTCHGISFTAYAESGGPCAATIVEAVEAAMDWDEAATAAK